MEYVWRFWTLYHPSAGTTKGQCGCLEYLRLYIVFSVYHLRVRCAFVYFLHAEIVILHFSPKAQCCRIACVYIHQETYESQCNITATLDYEYRISTQQTKDARPRKLQTHFDDVCGSRQPFPTIVITCLEILEIRPQTTAPLRANQLRRSYPIGIIEPTYVQPHQLNSTDVDVACQCQTVLNCGFPTDLSSVTVNLTASAA